MTNFPPLYSQTNQRFLAGVSLGLGLGAHAGADPGPVGRGGREAQRQAARLRVAAHRLRGEHRAVQERTSSR